MDTSSSSSGDELGEPSTVNGTPYFHKTTANNAIDSFAMEEVDGQLKNNIEDALGDDYSHTASVHQQTSTYPDSGEDDPATVEARRYHQWVDTLPDVDVEVRLQPFNPGYDYKRLDGRVDRILRERKSRGTSLYFVKLKSGHTEEVSIFASQFLTKVCMAVSFTSHKHSAYTLAHLELCAGNVSFIQFQAIR